MGMSMDLEPNEGQMEWEKAQSKRRRVNTGTENSFASLSVDDKLLHMFQKLENLERTNKSIENLAQGVNVTKAKVDHLTMRSDSHEQCLKVLAYKSIELEARSRRKNLLFHGLAECKNEKPVELLRDFLWDEMGLDMDNFYVESAHRLGSLFKARQRSQTPKRPIIVTFSQFSSIDIILDTAYMLKGTNFAVTRDYPKEIVTARRNLMPQYKEQRQFRGNKVTIEFPAKLVVNGKTIADGFPDWYSVIQMDRCAILNSTGSNVGPVQHRVSVPIANGRTDTRQTRPELTQQHLPRTYAQ